jgi:hypothetical protein
MKYDYDDKDLAVVGIALLGIVLGLVIAVTGRGDAGQVAAMAIAAMAGIATGRKGNGNDVS